MSPTPLVYSPVQYVAVSDDMLTGEVLNTLLLYCTVCTQYTLTVLYCMYSIPSNCTVLYVLNTLSLYCTVCTQYTLTVLYCMYSIPSNCTVLLYSDLLNVTNITDCINVFTVYFRAS